MFTAAVTAFGAARDRVNQALVNCNLGKLMRIGCSAVLLYREQGAPPTKRENSLHDRAVRDGGPRPFEGGWDGSFAVFRFLLALRIATLNSTAHHVPVDPSLCTPGRPHDRDSSVHDSSPAAAAAACPLPAAPHCVPPPSSLGVVVL